MTRRKRWFLTIGTIIGAIAILCVAALYTLQSGWFQQKLRERVIANLERSTGARVEIKSMDLRWNAGVVVFNSVIMHGSEPRDATPLFTAEEVRVGFGLTALLHRNLDLQFIAIRRPEIHITIRPDGSTNVPRPDQGRSNALESLIDLRVHHFAAEGGMLRVNFRRIPLRLSGRDMQMRCRYDPKGAAYEVRFSSKETSIEEHYATALPINVDGRVRLEKNRAIVQTFHLVTGNSTLTASGAVRNFANPAADFRLSSHIQAADAERFFPIGVWRGGDASLTGIAHYDASAGTAFRGTIAGRKLTYRSRSLDVSGIDLDSELSGSQDRLQFSHLVLSALGAKLTGRAELSHLTDLKLNGAITRLDLDRAASKLFQWSLPLNAVADGRIYFSSDLAKRIPDNLLRAQLNLQPAPAGTPVSGFLDLAYRTPAHSLEFNPSHVNLSATQLSFSGTPSTVMPVALESTDLTELRLVLAGLHIPKIPALPVMERDGSAHFDGTVTSLPAEPQITGNVALSNFQFKGNHWDVLRSQISLSAQLADFRSFTLISGESRATGNGHLTLLNWTPAKSSQIRVDARFQGIDLAQAAFRMPAGQPVILGRLLSSGIASGSVALSGGLSDPVGKAQLHIDNTDSNGMRMNQIQASASLEPNQVRLTQGRVQSGSAVISFSGTYTHPAESWQDGRLVMKIDSNGFPLASVPEWRRLEPAISASAEIHGQGAVRIASGHIEPATADGILKLRNVAYEGAPLGAITVNAATSNGALKAKLAGDLRGHSLSGSAAVQLVAQSPMNGEIHFDRVDIAALRAIIYSGQNGASPVDGTASGGFTFEGPLLTPRQWRSKLQIDDLELRPKLPKSADHKASALLLHNVGPVIVNAADGIATLSSFEIRGKDTGLSVAGSIHYDPKPALDVRMNGSVNLQILQIFDPALQSSGRATIAAVINGTIGKPALTGTLDIAQGMFFTANLPNGLSNVNGRIAFNRDRATIQKLTANVGGGDLALSGFVGFGGPGTLVYHVQANAGNVRLRYAGGISVTANADLRLTGSSQSSILAGTATVSRVIFNPNTDVGNLLAAFSAAAVAPANTNEFVSGLHLDVAVESTPNLQLSTSLSRDVEAGIDIRLRGTPDHPVLLGSISANQGDIKVFGTKYSINRGEVSFQNTVRIEPVLDLDLQTQTRGITVNITISGTVNKLNIAYRSDPPLQPRDIIALLTVGRTPGTSSNMQTVQSSSDITAVQPGASTVLGQAISSPPNRLSKLFGITNVKIDPMVQGIITNTPQARLTLEQQVSRDLTVTYVTNLSQTSEQIFRVEWALNQQYSLVALRDENGEFGIDIQYKKRFR